MRTHRTNIDPIQIDGLEALRADYEVDAIDQSAFDRYVLNSSLLYGETEYSALNPADQRTLEFVFQSKSYKNLETTELIEDEDAFVRIANERISKLGLGMNFICRYLGVDHGHLQRILKIGAMGNKYTASYETGYVQNLSRLLKIRFNFLSSTSEIIDSPMMFYFEVLSRAATLGLTSEELLKWINQSNPVDSQIQNIAELREKIFSFQYPVSNFQLMLMRKMKVRFLPPPPQQPVSMSEFCQFLIQLKNLWGFGVAEFCRHFEMNHLLLPKLENNTATTNNETLRRIADQLGFQVVDLNCDDPAMSRVDASELQTMELVHPNALDEAFLSQIVVRVLATNGDWKDIKTPVGVKTETFIQFVESIYGANTPQTLLEAIRQKNESYISGQKPRLIYEILAQLKYTENVDVFFADYKRMVEDMARMYAVSIPTLTEIAPRNLVFTTESDPRMQLVQEIAKARHEFLLTVTQMAELVGVNAHIVKKMEKGDFSLRSINVLEKICEAFKIQYDPFQLIEPVEIKRYDLKYRSHDELKKLRKETMQAHFAKAVISKEKLRSIHDLTVGQLDQILGGVFAVTNSQFLQVAELLKVKFTAEDSAENNITPEPVTAVEPVESVDKPARAPVPSAAVVAIVKNGDEVPVITRPASRVMDEVPTRGRSDALDSNETGGRRILVRPTEEPVQSNGRDNGGMNPPKRRSPSAAQSGGTQRPGSRAPDQSERRPQEIKKLLYSNTTLEEFAAMVNELIVRNREALNLEIDGRNVIGLGVEVQKAAQAGTVDPERLSLTTLNALATKLEIKIRGLPHWWPMPTVAVRDTPKRPESRRVGSPVAPIPAVKLPGFVVAQAPTPTRESSDSVSTAVANHVVQSPEEDTAVKGEDAKATTTVSVAETVPAPIPSTPPVEEVFVPYIHRPERLLSLLRQDWVESVQFAVKGDFEQRRNTLQERFGVSPRRAYQLAKAARENLTVLNDPEIFDLSRKLEIYSPVIIQLMLLHEIKSGQISESTLGLISNPEMGFPFFTHIPKNNETLGQIVFKRNTLLKELRDRGAYEELTDNFLQSIGLETPEEAKLFMSRSGGDHLQLRTASQQILYILLLIGDVESVAFALAHQYKSNGFKKVNRWYDQDIVYQFINGSNYQSNVQTEHQRRSRCPGIMFWLKEAFDIMLENNGAYSTRFGENKGLIPSHGKLDLEGLVKRTNEYLAELDDKIATKKSSKVSTAPAAPAPETNSIGDPLLDDKSVETTSVATRTLNLPKSRYDMSRARFQISMGYQPQTAPKQSSHVVSSSMYSQGSVQSHAAKSALQFGAVSMMNPFPIKPIFA